MRFLFCFLFCIDRSLSLSCYMQLHRPDLAFYQCISELSCLEVECKLGQAQYKYNLLLTFRQLHRVSTGPNTHYRFPQSRSKHSGSSEYSSSSNSCSRSSNISASSKTSSSGSLAAAALWCAFPSFGNVSEGIDQTISYYHQFPSFILHSDSRTPQVS